MAGNESSSNPLAALVAMAVIAGVVGSLWWGTREETAQDAAPAAAMTGKSGASTAPVAPRRP